MAMFMAAGATELVTIEDVELVSTGTYPLAGNATNEPDTTFTEDDLADMVKAFGDPTVPAPRLKVGHDFDWLDGEPAFGKIANMRLSANGQSVVGDYVDVPKWLADILPSAYPSRSMEGGANVTVPSGKTYRMVMTAMSLLGVSLPGVSSIDDLSDMYGSTPPEGVVLGIKDKIAAALGSRGGDISAMAVEDVKRSYYETLDAEQQWWWVRSTYVDPNELIVDDDEGGLYRVTYDVSGNKVTFSEPTEVKIKYVNAAQEIAASATYASRSESRPETTKEDTVDSKEIRERLGLPEDASDEDVRAALDAAKAEEPGDGEDGDGDGTDPAEEEGADDEGAGEEEGADTPAEPEAVAAGTKTIDAQEYDRLMAAANQGVEARTKQLNDERDADLDAAIKAGKFAPARRDHYEAAYKADPKGTKALLASLEPGLVPVDEVGQVPSDESLEGEAYPASWVPEVQARRERESSQRVITEV
jgi:hypothetical protein